MGAGVLTFAREPFAGGMQSGPDAQRGGLMMLRLFRFRDRYGEAVRHAADQLVSAHGPVADREAWRAARMPGLAENERIFCQAVAEQVTHLLGRAPDTAG